MGPGHLPNSPVLPKTIELSIPWQALRHTRSTPLQTGNLGGFPNAARHPMIYQAINATLLCWAFHVLVQAVVLYYRIYCTNYEKNRGEMVQDPLF